MATDGAAADAERRPDSRPRQVEEAPDGRSGAGAAPTAGQAPARGLGAAQVQRKAASGNAAVGAPDAPAEQAADAAADRVMRMPDPSPASPAPVPVEPAPPAASGAAEPARRTVRRAPDPVAGVSADPVAQQRLPGGPAATAATAGGSGAVEPDTRTPVGVTGPVSSPAEPAAPAVPTGTPAPDPEPPAPEGEAPARGTPVVPDDVQDYLIASAGQGAPLPPATRAFFETSYGRPLDDVRVHDDGAADRAARALDALAFTRGNDVYFRSGAYDPTSAEGKRLLAHELAHIVQQRPGVNRRVSPGLGGSVVRRAKSPGVGSESAGSKTGPAVAGSIDVSKKTISIERLVVPKFKATRMGSPPYELRKGTREENPTKQAATWRRRVKDDVQKVVANHIEKESKAKAGQTGSPAWFLKLGTTDHYFIGTPERIANDSRIPAWDKAGALHSFDIDHKREAQLGGVDEPKTPTGEPGPGNLWLLDSALNRSAGSIIRNNISYAIAEFLTKTAPKQAGIDVAKIPGESVARKDWTIQFEQLEGKGSDVTDNDFWEESELKPDKDGLVRHIRLLDGQEVEKLRGTPESLKILSRTAGGRVRSIPRSGDDTQVDNWSDTLFTFEKVSYTAANGAGQGVGKLTGTAFKDNSHLERAPFSVPITPVPGLPWTGVVTPGRIDHWRLKALSPLSFPELEFDVIKGFVGHGVLPKPSIRLLEDVEFAVVLNGELRAEASVTADALRLPGPLKATGGQLAVAVDRTGPSVRGRATFEIGKLAKGYLAAAASASGSGSTFELEGGLDFDSKMFTEAHIGVTYREGKWGASGKLAVGPDKIKGIKNASAVVEVNDQTVTAVGEFVPSLKGIEKGTLKFLYDETNGMEISGEILLGKGIPGIKSGKLDATVKDGPQGWSLSGGVTAEPDVPGLTGKIAGTYADGAFAVEADLGYERGQAKGTVKVGLTNRTLAQDGQPTGPIAPDGSLTAYGGGTVTLTITPWLQGTVGLKLTPKGEVEVSGKVALPSSFQVFPEKKVERKVLSIGIDIPIVGVAVAGQRIGIFATIQGGVTIGAGFGPGELRDVSLAVTYLPNDPDATVVTGTGTFVVPAHAGLRLQVDGGLGVGIPIVSATAGVSVYGEVGLEGAASASTSVNWTPRAGIVLDAKGEIFVEPKFRFGVDAFVDVSADLWLTTIELYHEKWKLAAFEYGSNLRFGLVFPLHYESGKPFDVSFDQIQWTYPQINASDLLGGLMKQLVG